MPSFSQFARRNAHALRRRRAFASLSNIGRAAVRAYTTSPRFPSYDRRGNVTYAGRHRMATRRRLSNIRRYY